MPFIDIKTMNIHQKMVFLIEKTMEPYSKGNDFITEKLKKHTNIQFSNAHFRHNFHTYP